MRSGSRRPVSPAYAAILWILLALFCLRVAGQALVAFFGLAWLPPMAAWQSGLLPYPWLLASQIAIVVLFAKVSLDLSRNRGFFSVPRGTLGIGLLAFGTLYLVAMLARYGFRMALYPDERWTGGSIPTFFHWVLAAFVVMVGVRHDRLGHRAGSFGRALASLPGAARGIILVVVAVALGLALWAGYFMSGRPQPSL